jgi:Sensors of blue-light using FAD
MRQMNNYAFISQNKNSALSSANSDPKMSVSLRQLVYCSIVTAEFHVGSINEIHASAHKNSAVHPITGFLIHSGNWFLQMLEGPTESIDEIYFKKICSDPRHSSLRVLEDRPAYSRNFSSWNVAYQYMNGDSSFFGGTMNKPMCRSISREMLARAGKGERLIGEYLKQIAA